MKKVYWDTNVMLDILLEREKFFESAARLWLMVENKEIFGIVSPLSMTTLEFILSRNIDEKTAKKALLTIAGIFEICDVSANAATLALNSKLKDFEDAVQYYSALEAKADFIITRNIKDFPSKKAREIEVLTPDEFLLQFEVQ